MNEIIHVVFITDENYALPTAVAVLSILKSKKLDSSYYIHIIGCEITEESKKIFEQLEVENFKIEIQELSPQEYFSACEIEKLHVSTAALFKFNIANLFPDIDKIIYLDGDVLVRKDLSELNSIVLGDDYAAVVKDYKPMTYKPTQVEKLKVAHRFYFNSGVMLLNLKKFREDDLFHKLLHYRLHGINYFMDQDALNVVFQEKVKYLPFYYNVMSSVMGSFSNDVIAEYYDLPKSSTKLDVNENAVILHLCTKYKPWEYYNVPLADEWYEYFQLLPFKGSKGIERKFLEKTEYNTFSQYNLTDRSELKVGIAQILVSLTSFPARINTVHLTIESILSQKIKADKIILWLAESEFPQKMKDLPENLKSLCDKGLEIQWCEDLKPHKKYFFAMQKYPDSIIVTIDDDTIYPDNLLQKLLNSYKKYPFAVSAMRAHLISMTSDNKVGLYKTWKREITDVGFPSMALCATGVGGVLYPPHIFNKEIFNKNVIERYCLYADDLWLKVMQLINQIPVVIADRTEKISNIPGTQEKALWKENDSNGKNDIVFRELLDIYDGYFSSIDTLSYRLSVSVSSYRKATSDYKNNPKLLSENKALKKQIRLIKESWSYRIGRFITFIPRKIRGGIRCYKENGMQYTLNRAKAKFRRLVRR